METNNEHSKAGESHVPPQHTGTEINAVEVLTIDSETDAISFFQVVKNRLLDVNNWTEISGAVMSKFYLTDTEGKMVERSARCGDHICIDIPGPGTKTGQGYDWVLIEQIDIEVLNNAEVLSMTVRPSENPLTNEKDTAHFLTSQATSTFQVKRVGNQIFAEEHGRNELINSNTENTMDNLRNTLVGWGAKVGLSYPQWKALVKGLLQQEIPEK